MLISYKIPVRMFNVEPDKISRIMYLIMFEVSLVARAMENEPLHKKTCLSGLASLKKQVNRSIIRMRGSRGPVPPSPGNSQVLY